MHSAEGVVEILENEEARHREAVGFDARKQEVAAERARKTSKASRDKKTGRRDAEESLHEDVSGKTNGSSLCVVDTSS